MKGFAESQSVGEVALGTLLGKVERDPRRGSGVWRGGRGSTGIPHGRGNRGSPGKGGKVSQGCHQTGKCRRDPRKGLGCHRDPHTGRVQKRPRKRAEGRAELSAGTPVRVRVLEGAVSVTFHGDGAEKPPGRRSVP